MSKIKLLTGLAFIIVSISLGAFGAHGLKPKITPDALAIFNTAVQYIMYNGLGLVAVFSVYQHLNNSSQSSSGPLSSWPTTFIVIGTLLFSVSILFLAMRSIIDVIPRSILGPITPIGGLMMIIGWSALFIQVLKINIK